MPIHTINASTLKQWLDEEQACLIDVREPEEYAAEHILGATLTPLATLTQHALPLHNGRKLVFQCRSGKRSLAACAALLADVSSLDVYNLEGGIVAWKAQGYPVEHAE